MTEILMIPDMIQVDFCHSNIAIKSGVQMCVLFCTSAQTYYKMLQQLSMELNDEETAVVLVF